MVRLGLGNFSYAFHRTLDYTFDDRLLQRIEIDTTKINPRVAELVELSTLIFSGKQSTMNMRNERHDSMSEDSGQARYLSDISHNKTSFAQNPSSSS